MKNEAAQEAQNPTNPRKAKGTIPPPAETAQVLKTSFRDSSTGSTEALWEHWSSKKPYLESIWSSLGIDLG